MNNIQDFFYEPKMIKIPQGWSLIGNIDKNIDFEDLSVKQIYIDYAFSMGKYPITTKEYMYFANEVNDHYPDWFLNKGAMYQNHDLSDNSPIVGVSYYDAEAYSKWLSLKTNKEYRLPTEEEWEYVARAGSNEQWCFGNDESLLKDYAWYLNNSSATIHPVGEKKANNWGIHDMHGNVFEWCTNWYSSSYNIKSEVEKEKILRGGSWKYTALISSSGYRDAQFPDRKNMSIGFRVLRAEE